MNTAQVMAWLTCLALAFFACILSVLNMGDAMRLRREVDQVRQEIGASGIQRGRFSDKDLERIRESVVNIREQLQATREASGGFSPAELKGKLSALDANLRAIEEELGKPSRKEPQ
jgi:hypothetical protein